MRLSQSNFNNANRFAHPNFGARTLAVMDFGIES